MVHQIWLGKKRKQALESTYSAEELNVVQRDIGRLAQYTIDGASYTNSSNVISVETGSSGAIAGVELTLKAPGSFSLDVSPPGVDKTLVTQKVKDFISAYNDALDLMREMERLKQLEEQLLSGDVDAVDLDRLRELLGNDAARNFQVLKDVMLLLVNAGYLTQRPGVCLTVSAPGFLNGLTALAK